MATQQEVQILKKEIAQIKNMLSDQLDSTPENGLSRTVFTTDDLQRVASQAGESVRTFLANSQQQIEDAASTCQNTIKERPILTAAVAFASGALLTALLKRK